MNDDGLPSTDESTWNTYEGRGRKSFADVASTQKTSLVTFTAKVGSTANTRSATGASARGFKKRIVGSGSTSASTFQSSIKIQPKTVIHVDNVSPSCDDKMIVDHLSSCGIKVASTLPSKS